MSEKLSILVIGDPHFRAKWIKTVDEFIRQTLAIVENKKPDVVVVLGDILHDHEQTRESCHSRAVNWFRELSKHSYLIVLIGNHDRPNNGVFLTKEHFFNGLQDHSQILIVDDKANATEITKNGYTFRLVSVPYVPVHRFGEALETLKYSIEEKRPDIVFAHQEFKGSKMGAIVSEEGFDWPEDAPLMVSGHIHEFHMPQKNMIYVGTPYQTTYAEDKNKGIYIFNLKPSEKFSLTQDVKKIRLKLRVKDSITVSAKDFLNITPPDSTLDLRIVVTGEQEEVMAVKQHKLYKDLIKLPYVKIILRPTLDIKFTGKSTGGNGAKVPYIESLFSRLKTEDEQLRDCYKEIFSTT